MNQNDVIGLPVSEGYRMVMLNEIISIQSDGNYSKVFLGEGMVHVNKNLNGLDEILDSSIFVRTHHQYLVSKYFVESFIKKDGQLVLKNGAKIPVSVRKKKAVLEFFQVIL